ncbi:MAG: acetylxylan esterase [Rariglobus sp.]|jgi:cephalosporin-C deacetylase-like acetyl esterase|nr:acetylxylan esterase [Rariglobus sp.]
MKPIRLLPFAAFLGLAVSAGFAQDAAPAPFAIPAVPANAQARVAAVQVRVAPDRAGWTYQAGEPVKFLVNVTADNQPLAGATLRYKVGPEMLPADEKTASLPEGGLVIDGGTLKEPGFIRCSVTVDVAGKTYRGLATAGLSPEKIQPTQTDPADFDAFWEAGKAELAKIPLEARQTLMPDACTDTVNVYHVSFRNVGGGWNKLYARVYGILCVPKAPGKYPAVLGVPGAGVRPYGGMKELAARGAITLQIGIHGIPVNLPQETYDQLGAGALNGYNSFNLDNRDAYYYRRVYLGCVRANDFLVSLPEYDGKNLVVTGGSQGGQLSIVTAALDPRVKGLAAFYPAYCDVTGYLHGRAGGWPHMMRANEKTGEASRHATAEKIAVTGYYDAVNFARRLKVPVHFAWGYNDETCPPTSLYAVYNVITSPKRLVLALETGHSTLPEENEASNAWIAETLGLK